MAAQVERTYTRIADELRTRIRDGVLKPGDLLPSEAALRAEFGVARGTARQALALIEQEGLVEVAPGRGRIVRDSAGPAPQMTAQYRRIADELRQAITNGDLRPGNPLPSEATIVAQHGVSRGTARQALALLVNEGYAISQQGRGRIVAPTRSQPARRLDA